MNKILSLICPIVFSAGTLLSCGNGVRQTAVMSDEVTYTYTVNDIQNLQDFLLGKSSGGDLSGKPYDLDGDNRWSVFDLALMREKVTPTNTESSDTLVVYFSQTGNTGKIAEYLIGLTHADSYVIEAAVPYTAEDISYQNSGCRANQEQNDKSVRPEIASPIESLNGYDTIFLGYPIWWGEEPRIIDTFLESYDFSDKTVIPFCTSGSSGISTSERNIASLADIGTQLPGKRFSASASESDVSSWLDSLELPEKQSQQKLIIDIGGTQLTATLADTQAAKELAENIKSSGAVTADLSEYGGFEKVGNLPWSLTRSDQQTETKPGDIMLYQGDKMTIFYGSNSWSYTSLGSIDNITQDELSELFGSSDITVTLTVK